MTTKNFFCWRPCPSEKK